MKELKKKMLSLGVFNDNEYLDLYCLLITNNKKQKRIRKYNKRNITQFNFQ